MPAVTQERPDQVTPAAISRPASGVSIDPERLIWWRESRGWSRQDFARAVDALGLTDEDGGPLTVSRDAIAKIENGERRPKPRTVWALCEALSRVRVAQYENGTYAGDTWELAGERVTPRELMPGGAPLTPHEDAIARRARLAHNRNLRAFARAHHIRYKNPVSDRIYYSRPLRDAYELSVFGASDEQLADAVARAQAGSPPPEDDDEPGSLTAADSIEHLNLTVRTHNNLSREQIRTIGELAGRTAGQLLEIRDLGTASLDEIRERLAAAGFMLQDEPVPELLAS